MPNFNYRALDSSGAPVTGQIEAADWSDAREQLLARGFAAPEALVSTGDPVGPLAAAPSVDPTTEPVPSGRAAVSKSDALEITTHLAALTSADLPLAPGLRALAVDMPRGRLATALGLLADHLQRGLPLEKALEMPDIRLPAHLRGALACGIGSGRLGPVLEELMAHQQLSYELRRRVWGSIAYPATLVVALALWCWFMLAMVVPSMAKIFGDFGIALPAMTACLIWLSGNYVTIVLDGVIFVGLLLALVRLVGGSPGLSNFLAALPFFGPLWRDWGLAEFSSLLALLLEHSTPLPSALRMTASGVNDAAVAAACRRSARSADEGRSLADSLAGQGEFPASLTPIVSWGERLSSLPSALRTAAEMFRARTELREQFLAAALPPIAFIVIALVLGYFITAMFMPLIKLIQTLSK